MKKKKFIIATTIPATFTFFKGNLRFLSGIFDVCAVSSDKEKLSLVGIEENVRIYCIPMVRSISLLRDIECLFAFISFFIKERPGIVHGNTPKAAMLSMLAAKLTRVPKRIYMCHGLRYQGSYGLMKWLLMNMERLSCRCATKVICVSNGVKNTLVKDKICPEWKAVVAGYGSACGIDLDRFNPTAVLSNVRYELDIKKDDFVFIFVGRIVRDKGINELVGAFEKLNNNHVHLILVGNEERSLNPISDETRTMIEKSPLIHAVGNKQDIRPYLMAANAFVFPSYREGFGMVLIEAGAMGLPCISSDIIGCNEIIVSSKNGDLVPPRNQDALYKKMQEWINNPEKVKAMSSVARKMVVERYEQKKVWTLLLKEYLA